MVLLVPFVFEFHFMKETVPYIHLLALGFQNTSKLGTDTHVIQAGETIKL